MKLDAMPPEVAIDLIDLTNALKGVTHDSSVSYGKTAFAYTSLDKIMGCIKSNNNFAVLLPLGTNENGHSAIQVIAIHKSGHVIASDYYKLRVKEDGTKQDEGSAITYTKRYAVGAFFGMTTDEDTDANVEGSGMQLTKAPAKQERAQKPLKPPAANKPADVAQKPAIESGYPVHILSAEQVERVYSLYGRMGIPQAAVPGRIFKKYGTTIVDALTVDDYNDLCQRAEEYFASKEVSESA